MLCSLKVPIHLSPKHIQIYFIKTKKKESNFFRSSSQFRTVADRRPPMAPVSATGAIVAAVSIVVASLFVCNLKSKSSSKRTEISKKKSREGLIGAIGNTPLIRINSLSEATGCEVRNWAPFK